MNELLVSVHVILLISIAIMLWKKEPRTLRNFFLLALLLKCFAGIGLGILYLHYYKNGDTWNYYNDGIALAKLARENTKTYLHFLWFGDGSYSLPVRLNLIDMRALFLSKITSIFVLVCGSNYWIITAYFSSISFYGVWCLVRALHQYYPKQTISIVVSFLFVPSVVFWTSGLIKESLATAALFFLASIFIKLWHRDKVFLIEWILTLSSLWVLWMLKYYYFALFVPIALTTLVVRLAIARYINFKSFLHEVVVWLVVLALPLMVVSGIHPNFYPDNILAVIVANNEVFVAISEQHDVIHFHQLDSTVSSMITNAPLALVSGLFRPFIWEATNILQAMVAFENLVLLIFFLLALKNFKNKMMRQQKLLLFALIMYIFLLAIFLTLSAPNFGTLSRYRVAYLPFFVFLILQGVVVKKHPQAL